MMEQIKVENVEELNSVVTSRKSTKKIVTKEDILFKHDGDTVLPIEIETILPVNGVISEEPVYMKLKVIPFLREELKQFNSEILSLSREYDNKVRNLPDGEEKDKLELERDSILDDLRIKQERFIILEKVSDPKFTETEFKMMPQNAIDAIYMTVMCASGIPKNLLVK